MHMGTAIRFHTADLGHAGFNGEAPSVHDYTANIERALDERVAFLYDGVVAHAAHTAVSSLKLIVADPVCISGCRSGRKRSAASRTQKKRIVVDELRVTRGVHWMTAFGSGPIRRPQ